MKSDISALLDDELEQGEASQAIDALRRDKELQEAWSTYHLIGDTLRRSPELSPHLSLRVMARLAKEPVLLVPSARPKSPLQVVLQLAAAVMGMAVVGWLALSLNPSQPQPVELAAKPRPTKELAVPVSDKSPSGTLKEYLVAHQAHSPSGGIQGVAPYVRTVSEIRQGGRP